jgi:hypothetical protein
MNSYCICLGVYCVSTVINEIACIEFSVCILTFCLNKKTKNFNSHLSTAECSLKSNFHNLNVLLLLRCQ